MSYQIVCTRGLPAGTAALAAAFLSYAASDTGQAAVADVGYAPLPTDVASRVRTVIGTIS